MFVVCLRASQYYITFQSHGIILQSHGIVIVVYFSHMSCSVTIGVDCYTNNTLIAM